MDIKMYENVEAKEILNILNNNNVNFDKEKYSCLISPCSILIDKKTSQKIEKDISSVWEWVKTSQEIYRKLIEEKDFEDPLLKALEWNLTEDAIYQQRLCAIKGCLPKLGRLDSVILEPNQKIAEVQWKGGGEGFIYEVQKIYSEKYKNTNEKSFGDMIDGFAKIFACTKNKQEINVLNTGRNVWMNTEKHLAKDLKKRNINLISLPANEINNYLEVEKGKVYIKKEKKYYKLDYIYLDRLSEVLPKNKFNQVIEAYFTNEVIIDPPPSYIYNQKITLALPFSEKYGKYFSENVKNIFIPTVIMDCNKPNLKAIIPYIKHHKAELLAEIETWNDLINLPSSLREQLVLKCASTDKFNNHGGHGVFRLWGSKSVAEKVLQKIMEYLNNNETWIIQPYINETWNIPFAHPEKIEEVKILKAHGRFGIYCGSLNNSQEIIGSIATFSPFWKVAGKTADYDKGGNLFGSSFTDVRVNI